MSNELALMCGTDIPCPQFQITFHQPVIQEIALIGETNFFTGVQCLLINKKLVNLPDNFDLSQITNFHIFMMIMQEKTESSKKDAVQMVLSLILPDFSSTFIPNRSLLLTKEGQTVTLDENNFESFQQAIKEFLSPSFKDGTDGTGTFNPQGKKAEEIAKKLMRGRERVAAQQAENGGSALSQYISILTVGLGLPPKEISNLTLYGFFDLIERYMLYVNWDIDIRARMAGAKADKPMDNWMKKLR